MRTQVLARKLFDADRPPIFQIIKNVINFPQDEIYLFDRPSILRKLRARLHRDCKTNARYWRDRSIAPTAGFD
jgi:hypothetical protein